MSDKEERPAEEQDKPAETSADSAAAQPAGDSAERSVKKGTLVILALILASLTWYLLSDRFTPYTRQARVQGFVIGIAPKVAGVVTQVWAKNNQRVEQDEQLFEIDPSQYEIALKRAKSDLENTRSQVDAGSASVETARANLRAALANEVKAEQDAKRQQRMHKEDSGSISVRRLEVSQATWEQAQAKVAAANSEIQRSIQSMGGEAEDNAKLKAAQSAVEKAALDLENTMVKAPSGGIITDLRADVGQYAGTGSPVVTLIAIHDVWINAEFTENNLGNLTDGSPAALVFDSLPGRVFDGHVRSIGLGVSAGQAPPAGSLPQVDNNRDWLRQSQRFPVQIGFDPKQSDELRNQLRVGGQAEVMAFSDGHPVLQLLGRAYMRLMSWLSYLY